MKQPTISKYLLWLFACFFLLMGAGCSKKDSAIDSLKAKNIAITADSLAVYSSQGDLPVVKLLLDAGIDVNAKNSRGSNVLIEASWAGKQEVVSYLLLEAKANINSTSSTQLSALSAAIGQKHETVALLLVDHGANPNVFDISGSTPLIEAAWLGQLTLVKTLLSKGANANYKRSDNGFTALKAAASKPEIIQALKAAGATE